VNAEIHTVWAVSLASAQAVAAAGAFAGIVFDRIVEAAIAP